MILDNESQVDESLVDDDHSQDVSIGSFTETDEIKSYQQQPKSTQEGKGNLNQKYFSYKAC